MVSDAVVELSRWQFAITSLYHFLFVPLTIGLSVLLAIMETLYVVSGREIYKDMTLFWGKLFAVNFALGVATGLLMEFQFGMNWSYFSYYVGDIFGAPLAIGNLMAFFMESTFVGLFFFGWDKLSKGQHLTITWLVAIGSNLSILWILIANSWMQNPVGAEFNYETMRMEVVSFSEVIFNPIAQAKFIHTVSASYVVASSFVLSISAYYMLKDRDLGFAQRSFTLAAGFGLAAILSVIFFGDKHNYNQGEIQKTKLAIIAAQWTTEEPPAALTLVGIPDQKEMKTYSAIKLPWLLGLLGTSSVDVPITGLTEIMLQNREHILNGIKAYSLLQELRDDDREDALIAEFESLKKDLGYGLLLKRYTENIIDATDEQIDMAVKDSIPQVTPLFWAFRIMVMSGLVMLFVFIAAVISSSVKKNQKDWVLKLSLYTLPLPWIACETGWFVTEFGRQPWAVSGILPTFISTSSLTERDILFSLIGYFILYTLFLVIEISLVLKLIKMGPSYLYKKNYYFETGKIDI